jgi:putative transposase
VLACYRNIELNPVRANMVNHPRDYPWSSYRCNAEGKSSDLIVPHEQYLELEREERHRKEMYRALFKAHVDDHIRTATNGNYVLGNQRFQEQIAHALGRRVTKGKAGRPKQEGRC